MDGPIFWQDQQNKVKTNNFQSLPYTEKMMSKNKSVACTILQSIFKLLYRYSLDWSNKPARQEFKSNLVLYDRLNSFYWVVSKSNENPFFIQRCFSSKRKATQFYMFSTSIKNLFHNIKARFKPFTLTDYILIISGLIYIM